MKKQNSLKVRLILAVSALVILAILVISITTVYSLYSNGQKEAASIREKEMNIYRAKLTDTLDMVFTAVEDIYHNYNTDRYLEKVYGSRLKSVVDSAYSIIADLQNQVKNGSITERIAKRKASEYIKNIRYSNGTGYLWINDTTLPYPRMIMHPTVPALDGKILNSTTYNVVEGTKENLFTAMVKATAKSGEGYVRYLWPKPTADGLTKDQPKLSYVRRVAGWNWIIGTGIYIDDARGDMLESIKNSVKQFRYDKGVGYFWINDMSRPFPKMVMHPTVPALDGKTLDNKKYNVVKGTGENLFVAMVNACAAKGDGFVQYKWPKPTENGLTKEQPKLSYVRLFKPLNWIIGTGVYIDDIDKKVTASSQRIRLQTLSLVKKFTFTAVIILAVIIVILIFMISRITKPIIETTRMLEELSKGEGDLTKQLLIHSKDEVGRMSEHFNTFMSKLKNIISGMKSVTVQSGDIGRNLKTNTDQVKTGMNNLVESSEGVKQDNLLLSTEIGESKSSVDEISDFFSQLLVLIESQSAALTEASAAIEEMAASIRNISSVAREKKQFSSNLVSLAEAGETEMNKTINSVTEISESAAEVLEMIKIINDIAEMTNLLSMNAAIEAAHAGSAGAGFSVVANEIKKLAESVEGNVQDISSSLHTIVEKINGTLDISKNAAGSFHTISSGVKDVSSGIDEMEQGLHELALASDQISEAQSDLMNTTETINESSRTLGSKTVSITEAIEKVVSLSGKTTEKMNIINNLVHDMNSNISNLYNLGIKNEENINLIEKDIEKFKTDA